MSADGLDLARRKMQEAGVPAAAVDVFSRFYGLLASGETGVIREADVTGVTDAPLLADLQVDEDAARDAIGRTVVVKLNGGLGTSMGMDRAKSLLRVRGDLRFLDVIARQVLATREATGARLPLLLMNSFRTRADTLEALSGYDDLAVADLPLDFLQNREPKLRADDLTPVEWPADPSLEWCPPGHGDLYTTLYATGILRRLLDAGFRHVSVSNADNLGASPDPRIAAWFAASGAPYAAEVCRRTPADRKGGHLVRRLSDGRIVLRETAQTLPEDADAAADMSRHPYFHTNNLWMDLEVLSAELERTGGVLHLPLIRNEKTVDPTDPSSTKVVQIESAMGAAVEVFDGAAVLEVPRSRFLPVKTTDDLLVLRSDVYATTADHRLVAQVPAPLVTLDPAHYKTIAAFEQRIPQAPSLVGATSFTVEGDWTFGTGVTVEGDARLGADGAPGRVPDGARVTADGI